MNDLAQAVVTITATLSGIGGLLFLMARLEPGAASLTAQQPVTVLKAEEVVLDAEVPVPTPTALAAS